MCAQATLFVGLGSSHGDDRVGWMVADALVHRLDRGTIIRHAKAPFDILGWLEGVERLAICDACRGIGPVGSWRRWEPPLSEFPAVRARHSHDLGLAAALRLASQLNVLPRQIWLWGIEIDQTGPERPACPQVVAAVAPVAADVENQLAYCHA